MIQKNGTAPYAPASAVIDLIERYRNHGLSTPFDQEVLIRAGVSESLAPRTLQALRLLDLINESGDPTPELNLLGDSNSDEYPDYLQKVLRAAYADVFAFTDPTTDSPERIEDAFRGYSPRGQRQRMVSLFLGLCRHAGMSVPSPKREAPAKNKGTAAAPRPGRTAPNTSGNRPLMPSRQPKPKPPQLPVLPQALESLVNDLPTKGEAWTEPERDAFLAAFRAMVDVYFPVRYDERKPRGELLPGPQ